MTLINLAAGGSILAHAPDQTQQKQQIGFAQLLKASNGLLNQFGVMDAFIKEQLGAQVKIVANGKEFLQGWQRLAGGNVVHIPSAVTQVIAHLILGHTLAQPQLRNPLADKIFVHQAITSTDRIDDAGAIMI